MQKVTSDLKLSLQFLMLEELVGTVVLKYLNRTGEAALSVEYLTSMLKALGPL